MPEKIIYPVPVEQRRARRPKRYRVDRASRSGAWVEYSRHRFAWSAKQTAKGRESYGYFRYRVVDTRPEEKKN